MPGNQLRQKMFLFVFVVWLSTNLLVEATVVIPISNDLSIEFMKLGQPSNSEHGDGFVYLTENWVVGDSGSATYQGYKYENANNYTFKESYSHDSSHPSIEYAFPISETEISNLGTFTSLSDGQRVKSINSTNYSHFHINGSTLSFTIYHDILQFTQIPYGIMNGKFVSTGLR